MTEGSLLIFKKGDLLQANEQYIVHQCNCVTKKAKGLAAAIFEQFPYSNCYVSRTQNDIPGTIKIFGNGKNERYIINLFGQFTGGKPKAKDSKEMRLQYFHSCLKAISEIPNLQSIAFPFHIGCGLAGGDWSEYQSALEQFAKNVHIPIVIYKKEEEETE